MSLNHNVGTHSSYIQWSEWPQCDAACNRNPSSTTAKLESKPSSSRASSQQLRRDAPNDRRVPSPRTESPSDVRTPRAPAIFPPIDGHLSLQGALALGQRCHRRLAYTPGVDVLTTHSRTTTILANVKENQRTWEWHHERQAPSWDARSFQISF